jgi:hypothetical protein
MLKPMFVSAQGNGVTGFREVMLGQHANEPRRKLLETRSFHFVLFLDDRDQIAGFELTDEDERHLFRWRRGRRPQFYGVQNVGKGYHNHDEVLINGAFQAGPVIAEVTRAGHNIRPEVRDVLLEGVRAYSTE